MVKEVLSVKIKQQQNCIDEALSHSPSFSFYCSSSLLSFFFMPN